MGFERTSGACYIHGIEEKKVSWLVRLSARGLRFVCIGQKKNFKHQEHLRNSWRRLPGADKEAMSSAVTNLSDSVANSWAAHTSRDCQEKEIWEAMGPSKIQRCSMQLARVQLMHKKKASPMLGGGGDNHRSNTALDPWDTIIGRKKQTRHVTTTPVSCSKFPKRAEVGPFFSLLSLSCHVFDVRYYGPQRFPWDEEREI